MPLENEHIAGHHELRRSAGERELATGTLACPACDVPVLPPPRAIAPSEPLACGWCAHEGAVRDFLSLAAPTRPTRVVVRVRGLALRQPARALAS